MKNVRKAIFWMHLAAGILAGVIIVIMSVTGVLLTYERQMIAWADNFEVEPAEVRLEALVQEVYERGEKPTAVGIPRDGSQPISLHFGRGKTEFVDPGTGESLGEGNLGVRRFFRTMLVWHRWLGQEGASQPTGRAIIGAGNLIFLFLVVSGLVLWFPKRWTRKAFAAVLLLKRGLKGKARDWNWHNALGFWACLPLFAIVASGVVMSYPWANGLVYRIMGDEPPGDSGHPRGGGREEPPVPDSIAGLDAAFEAVKAANPEWQTIYLTLPPQETAQFEVMDSHRGRPDKRRDVTVDLGSGEIVEVQGMEAASPGRQARMWLRWIHTGEAGGWFGQTLAGLASAVAVVLVWTGFALSWRRFFKRRRSAQ